MASDVGSIGWVSRAMAAVAPSSVAPIPKEPIILALSCIVLVSLRSEVFWKGMAVES